MGRTKLLLSVFIGVCVIVGLNAAPTDECDMDCMGKELEGDITIEWRFQSYQTRCVILHSSVTFTWSGGMHNVNSMDATDWMNCTGFADTMGDDTNMATFNLDYGPMPYYYACGVGAHCTNGQMRVKICAVLNTTTTMDTTEEPTTTEAPTTTTMKEDEQPLVAFPDGDVLLQMLGEASDGLIDFVKNWKQWGIQKICEFLKGIIDLLNKMKIIIKKILGLPFLPTKLSAALKKLLANLQKLCNILKLLSDKFDKIKRYLEMIKEAVAESQELLHEATDTCQSLSMKNDDKEVMKDIRDMFIGWTEKLNLFLEDCRGIIRSDEAWLERYREILAIRPRLEQCIREKKMIEAALGADHPLVQILKAIDRVLEGALLPSITSVLSCQKKSTKPFKKLGKVSKQVKPCQIPAIICVCDGNNPHVFWCETPKFKGCRCTPPMGSKCI